jgi:hypothetical protein
VLARGCPIFRASLQTAREWGPEIRSRHVIRFQDTALRGELTDRISVGNLVVDREVVTRNFAEGIGTIEVIAIYEIDDGKIAKAWFKMGTPRLAGA